MSYPATAFRCREARLVDASAMTRIYNEGIEDRTATFETRPRDPSEIAAWFDGSHPIVVVESEPDGVVGFAAASSYRQREAYSGIAEFSVYVVRHARGRGVGRAAMLALIAAAERRGFWKLVSRVFVDNEASRHLLTSVGFREVGLYRRHARLEGAWRDVIIVERLLGEAAVDAPDA